MMTATPDIRATLKRAQSALIEEAGMPHDLVQQLIVAATDAIRNETPALTHRPESIRGVTVEITLGQAGGLGDAVVFVERRTGVRTLATLDHATVRTA